MISVLLATGGCAESLPQPPPNTPTSRASSTATTDGSGRLIYVDKLGSNDGSGSQRDPVRTINAAISDADPGDTIVVGAGVYHESLKIEAHPDLTLRAADGATVWLDGSSVVDHWTRKHGVWSADWKIRFDDSPTYTWGAPDYRSAGWRFVDPRYPMAAHPDQVWIDDVRLRQVGSRSEVGSGTFCVDYATGKLILGSDPKGHTVRASSLAKAISIRSPGVALLGINIRRFAPSVPHMGAVTVAAARVRIEDLTITDNATTGLHVMSPRAVVKNVTVTRNGMIGITATGAHRSVFDGVVVRRNNLERFNSSPVAGGIKIGRTRSVVVRNSVIDDNLGNGLWFDESSYDLGVFNSRFINNSGHGLSVEISGRADIVGNISYRNGGNGIKINDSNDIQVWNNTLAGNDRAISVVQDDRDVAATGSYRDPWVPLSWQNRSVAIRNNVMTGTAGDTLLAVEDFTGRFSALDLDVTALGNLYHRGRPHDPRWIAVWSRGEGDPYAFKSLAPFRRTTRQEMPGALVVGDSILTADLGPSKVVSELAADVAQPLPRALADRVGRSVNDRHLGAWITRSAE